MKTITKNKLLSAIIFISALLMIGAYFPSDEPDFAGIYMDNAGEITIDLVNVFHQIKSFDTDGPEAISNGAHGTDNIAIGTTSMYFHGFHANLVSAANNKNFEIFSFEIAASGATLAFATLANPIVISSEGHGFSNGDRIKIEIATGIVELDDMIYTVAAITDSTLQLDAEGGVDINSGGYTAWDANGTMYLATELVAVHGHIKLGTNSAQEQIGNAFPVSLTGGNTVELYVMGVSDDTNVTIEDGTYFVKRWQ